MGINGYIKFENVDGFKAAVKKLVELGFLDDNNGNPVWKNEDSSESMFANEGDIQLLLYGAPMKALPALSEIIAQSDIVDDEDYDTALRAYKIDRESEKIFIFEYDKESGKVEVYDTDSAPEEIEEIAGVPVEDMFTEKHASFVEEAISDWVYDL